MISLRDNHGSVIVLIAVAMMVIVGVMMLVINTSLIMLYAGQAQNAADACSLGAAAALYHGDLPHPTQCYVAQLADIIDNLATANNCTILSWDYGHWDGNAFVQGGSIQIPIVWESATEYDLYNVSGFINAVKVIAIKSGTYINTSNIDLQRSAIAMVRWEACSDCNGTMIALAPGSALVQ